MVKNILNGSHIITAVLLYLHREGHCFWEKPEKKVWNDLQSGMTEEENIVVFPDSQSALRANDNWEPSSTGSAEEAVKHVR